jgi:hypothetical protein
MNYAQEGDKEDLLINMMTAFAWVWSRANPYGDLWGGPRGDPSDLEGSHNGENGKTAA